MSLEAVAFRRSLEIKKEPEESKPIIFDDTMALFARGFQGRTI
jgi:hypothetical protein